jgi:hypothetical protein
MMRLRAVARSRGARIIAGRGKEQGHKYYCWPWHQGRQFYCGPWQGAGAQVLLRAVAEGARPHSRRSSSTLPTRAAATSDPDHSVRIVGLAYAARVGVVVREIVANGTNTNDLFISLGSLLMRYYFYRNTYL